MVSVRVSRAEHAAIVSAVFLKAVQKDLGLRMVVSYCMCLCRLATRGSVREWLLSVSAGPQRWLLKGIYV